MTVNTDRIERQISLRAPPARVWRALVDRREFGEWFGVALEGEFVEGARVVGTVTSPGCEHLRFEMQIESIEPERSFSYRWRPHAVDPDVEYSAETTLVEFRLVPIGATTQLTVVESGFDRLPADSRAAAFRRNEGGWTQQIINIERHVAGH